ncbi:hypothetical protein B6H68_08495 [Campylobacter upsaliensis]|nr:hypothetical protein [Campylobacter upsaliensis]
MPRPRKRPTEIISLRVPKDLIYFFGTLENRNEYVLRLIENDEVYKKYLQEKELLRQQEQQRNQPKGYTLYR